MVSRKASLEIFAVGCAGFLRINQHYVEVREKVVLWLWNFTLNRENRIPEAWQQVLDGNPQERKTEIRNFFGGILLRR